jgi:acyl-CoA thioesterase-1
MGGRAGGREIGERSRAGEFQKLPSRAPCGFFGRNRTGFRIGGLLLALRLLRFDVLALPTAGHMRTWNFGRQARHYNSLMVSRRWLPLLALVFAAGCSIRDAACGPTQSGQMSGQQEGPGAAPKAITGEAALASAPGAVGIAFLGDSLTAGLGLLSNQTFPELIKDKFSADGFNVEVINGGISGDTTAGGVRRVEQLLEPNVKILVLALGGNDALRGLTVNETRDNLRQIIDVAQMHGVQVMLCGMEAPTNLGEDYRNSFKAAYFDVLRSYQRQIEYVPFLLEGVAGKPELNQADGIHPNADGSKIVAELLYPPLRKMVERIG